MPSDLPLSAIQPPDASAVRRVCVIGAGTMGAGIAAHLANVGLDVSLLDTDRARCDVLFARARASKPSHFTSDHAAQSIRLGGLETDADAIEGADWVLEAIVERLNAKHDLYRRIQPLLGAQTILSTNTSGLPIALLADGLDPETAAKFLGTHFFNPPRYLKLVELIPHAGTDPAYTQLYRDLIEGPVARRAVLAKDTPGFIANRFGMWALFHAIHCAERLQLSVEDVDAITGEFLGRPRSGTFRLADVVGIDVMADVAANLLARCADDPQIGTLRPPRSLAHLLERGSFGEKVGQGYTKREAKELLTLDLTTYAYRPRREPSVPRLPELARLPLAERIQEATRGRDSLGEFLRMHLPPTLAYARAIRPEVAHTIEGFDRVMRWGFGWSQGPFELSDALSTGDAPFYKDGKQLAPDGSYVNRADEPPFRDFADFPIADENATLVFRDLGDGVTGLGIRTKMGSINPHLVSDLSVALAGDGPFVLYSESKAFSVGYDLNVFLALIESGDLVEVEKRLEELQALAVLLGSKRVTAAVRGYCLGAGLELAAACGRIVADAESKIGFPEAKVGLLPGGGGTALMRVRAQSSAANLAAMVARLTEGTTSASAEHAREIGFLRPTDPTEFHPDRLATRAIAEASLSGEPRPDWAEVVGPVAGLIDSALEAARRAGRVNDYDATIGGRVKAVFTQTRSFDEALERERREFLDLCHRAPTVARIRHMLSTGKPLRNP